MCICYPDLCSTPGCLLCYHAFPIEPLKTTTPYNTSGRCRTQAFRICLDEEEHLHKVCAGFCAFGEMQQLFCLRHRSQNDIYFIQQQPHNHTVHTKQQDTSTLATGASAEEDLPQPQELRHDDECHGNPQWTYSFGCLRQRRSKLHIRCFASY